MSRAHDLRSPMALLALLAVLLAGSRQPWAAPRDVAVQAARGAPRFQGIELLSAETDVPSPSPTQAPSATPTPLVTGKVRLSLARAPEGCGQISLTAAFTATSPAGPVDTMRTLLPESQSQCSSDRDALRDRPWEPFSPSRAYTVHGGSHYYDHSASVQYRDLQGNLSPVYCTAISGVCLGTATLEPTIDPTPRGGPIAVGTPLPTPLLAANAIAPSNAAQLKESGLLDPSATGPEAVVGYTADGSRIVVTDGSGARILSSLDGSLLGTVPGAGGGGLISPDGTVLVTVGGSRGGRIDLWDLAEGRPLRQHVGGTPIGSLAFADEGRTLTSGRAEGAFQLYDVASGRLILNKQDDRLRFAWVKVAARPDAPVMMAAADVDSSRVTEYGADTGAYLRTIPTGVDGRIYAIMYGKEGAITVVVQGPPDYSDPNVMIVRQLVTVIVRQLGGRRTEMTFQDTNPNGPFYEFKWSPTGRWLALGLPIGIGDDQHLDLQLWDGEAAPRLLTREPGMTLAGLAWSPDGTVLAVGLRRYNTTPNGRIGAVRLYDATSGAELVRLPGVISPIFAPDGSTLIAVGDGRVDSALHVFRVEGSIRPPLRLALPWLNLFRSTLSDSAATRRYGELR